MADSYGATTLPVTAPSLVEEYTEPVGDPGIVTLLNFVAAVLEYEAGDAWDAVAPGEPICSKTRPHNPRKEDFSRETLPALFAYPGDAKYTRWADGYWVRERPITLLWVHPPAQDGWMPARRGVQTAIGAALHKALGPLNGRHPAWVVTGDTDEDAAVYGSCVLTHGGFQSLEMGTVREADITVGDVQYDGVTVEIQAREVFTRIETLSGSTRIIVRRDTAETTAPDPFDQTIDVGRAFDGAFSTEFF